MYPTRNETRPLNLMWRCYKIQTIEFSLVYSYVQKSTYRIDGVIAGIIVLDRAIKSGNTKAMRRQREHQKHVWQLRDLIHINCVAICDTIIYYMRMEVGLYGSY